MPGFEFIGEEERREIQQVIDSGVLMRYGFDAARKGQWKSRELEQRLAAKLGARWLFWGEQEQNAYPNSSEPWREQCHLHASGTWGALYDLTQPAVPPAQ